MIDHYSLDCGCVWETGTWDLCLFHRHKEGGTDYAGPVPLSGLDSEPVPVTIDECGPVPTLDVFEEIRSIFDAASGRADPYEASTRQARAEREARKAQHVCDHDSWSEIEGVWSCDHCGGVAPANHCPTCTCKKQK